jgi:hypothetical protein
MCILKNVCAASYFLHLFDMNLLCSVRHPFLEKCAFPLCGRDRGCPIPTRGGRGRLLDTMDCYVRPAARLLGEPQREIYCASGAEFERYASAARCEKAAGP